MWMQFQNGPKNVTIRTHNFKFLRFLIYKLVWLYFGTNVILIS